VPVQYIITDLFSTPTMPTQHPMVLVCFVNHWNRGSGGYDNALRLALFVVKSPPYENNVPLPCTFDTSTEEVLNRHFNTQPNSE
jgi:hypothetical protein